MRKKIFSCKELTDIISEYEQRFEALTDTLEHMITHQPDYAGAIMLNVFDAGEKLTTFYMVTKFCVVDPYITFYHLLPPEHDTPFSINSFPEKPKDKSTRRYIRRLERSGRWNKVYERLFIPNVERTQFIGHFTYSRAMELEDNHAIFIRPENTVLEFKNIKG